MLLSKLKGDYIFFSEQDWFSRHEAADDEVVFSLPIPLEVVEGTLCSTNFRDFVVDVMVEIETILSVV